MEIKKNDNIDIRKIEQKPMVVKTIGHTIVTARSLTLNQAIIVAKSVETIAQKVGAEIIVDGSKIHLEKEINGTVQRILTVDNEKKTITIVQDTTVYNDLSPEGNTIATGLTSADVNIPGYETRSMYLIQSSETSFLVTSEVKTRLEQLDPAIIKKFIADVGESPQLLELFNESPELIDAYVKLANTYMRTDVSWLRWIGNLQIESTKEINAKKLSKKYAIKDLSITEEIVASEGSQKTNICFYDGDRLLATYEDGVFKAKTTPGEPNNFLNQNLCPNTTYIVDDRFHYKTDNLGRVEEAEADLVLNKIGRNTDLQAIYRDENGAESGINALQDDGGHIFAQEVGGPIEGINIKPQLKIQNRGCEWRSMEKSTVNDLKAGKHVHMKVHLVYEDNDMIARPTKYHIIKTVNGVEEKLSIPNVV